MGTALVIRQWRIAVKVVELVARRRHGLGENRLTEIACESQLDKPEIAASQHASEASKANQPGSV
jgi:hypothetical protein